MLPKTKLYRIGDMMAGMQYMIIFMAPVMICNKFGNGKIGFVIGAIITVLMYLINHKTNEGAIKHYITYCSTPTYLEGNTEPSPSSNAMEEEET